MAMISTAELAKRYDVTPFAVIHWIRKGQLKATKVGKTWVISEDDLEGFTRPKSGRPRKLPNQN